MCIDYLFRPVLHHLDRMRWKTKDALRCHIDARRQQIPVYCCKQIVPKLLFHVGRIGQKPTTDWLIIYYFTSRSRILLIWRCHHSRWRAAKFRFMFGAESLWAGRDLYRATPTVTRDFGFLVSSEGPRFCRLYKTGMGTRRTNFNPDLRGLCNRTCFSLPVLFYRFFRSRSIMTSIYICFFSALSRYASLRSIYSRIDRILRL
jgi:hypothetical protein